MEHRGSLAPGRVTVQSAEDLFVAGEGGYHTYRIPALVVTASGAVLAFCEGRRKSTSDTGLIDILIRRSEDGGKTWSATERVVGDPGMTCGNPTPTFDPRTRTVWLPFCKSREDGPESMVFEGAAPRTAWMTRSLDDGKSWGSPEDVTAAVKSTNWSWFAFGPGHGTALASGRLLVPSVHANAVLRTHEDPCRAHVTVSDDGGRTWKIGGVIDVPTSSECELVELSPGKVYLNARYEIEGGGRVSAWSHDGGTTFPDAVVDPQLTDPGCQGSLVKLREEPSTLLLVNAAGPGRERLVARTSRNGGVHFREAAVLDPGKVAYSDVAVATDGTVLCLYERGDEHAYERITLKRFTISTD